MKNERNKKEMLETMILLNRTDHENENHKNDAYNFFSNSVEIGNKVFCYIPIDLLKIDHKMYQRPLQKNFKYLLENWDEDKCDPITVNYRGDGYFYVINGQHRTEAAKLKNIKQLCCDVFVGLTLKEEADLFVSQYDGNSKLNPVDSFRANIIRGEKVDTLIKDTCDKYGISVTGDKNNYKNLKGLSVIRRIVKGSKSYAISSKSSPEENIKIVDWIFNVLEDSDWECYKDTYNSDMLQCLWYIYKDYSSILELTKKRLCTYFKNSSPKEIKALGNLRYPEYGHGGGMYRIMKDIVTLDIKCEIKDIA